MLKRSFLLRGTALTAAVLLGACATGPEIRSDTHPQAAFPTYKTFAYFSPLATDKAGYESVFTARLKQATRQAMEARGYVYSEAAPDLLVNFYANVQDKQEIRTTPAVGVSSMGYYGYRRGYYGSIGMSTVETVTYREGTITVDLIESKRKILVWQSTAEGSVSNEARKNPGPAIDATVTLLMAALPSGRP
jgi:hypothetical protein